MCTPTHVVGEIQVIRRRAGHRPATLQHVWVHRTVIVPWKLNLQPLTLCRQRIKTAWRIHGPADRRIGSSFTVLGIPVGSVDALSQRVKLRSGCGRSCRRAKPGGRESVKRVGAHFFRRYGKRRLYVILVQYTLLRQGGGRSHAPDLPPVY